MNEIEKTMIIISIWKIEIHWILARSEFMFSLDLSCSVNSFAEEKKSITAKSNDDKIEQTKQ